jgi:acetyl esterase/lipase
MGDRSEIEFLMKSVLVASCLAVAFGGLNAQTSGWQPASGHTQIPIWPGKAPGTRTTTAAETTGVVQKSNVGGRPWIFVSRVSRPTMTFYAPKAKNTNAAVVVFPGGGYQTLAIDLEGTEVCDWLTSNGITCVLLKYRVPNNGPSWNQPCGCYVDTHSSMALEDAQRTIGLVRLHAAEYHIDPHKIGVIGFSAGGHLVAMVSTHFDRRVYRAIDAADRESSRPDFALALYPGHLWINEKKFELNPDVRVTRNTPPTFLVQAENDNVDNINDSLVYYNALKNAGVPAEIHVYAEGRHAFGLRPTKLAITEWPKLAETWLRSLGIISQ